MDERDQRRAKVVAAATDAAIKAATQFSSGVLGKHLGCRVEDVELDHLGARGVLEPVAKYIWQVRDAARFREWVIAKLDQRERHREPPIAREPEPAPPDDKLVLPLAETIQKYLAGLPEEQRALVLRAAVRRVTESPPPAPVVAPPTEPGPA